MSRELKVNDSTGVSKRDLLRSAIANKFGSVSGEAALLLDTTGSMYGDKIKKLRESVRAFPGVRRFQYADDFVELVPGREVREPGGGNNEPLAFTSLKQLGIKHVVMITDGYPDNPEESLRAATGLKIDIIYIGPQPAPDFLRQLALKTGGSYDGTVTFSSLDGANQLEKKMRLCLEAGSATEAPKERVIIL